MGYMYGPEPEPDLSYEGTKGKSITDFYPDKPKDGNPSENGIRIKVHITNAVRQMDSSEELITHYLRQYRGWNGEIKITSSNRNGKNYYQATNPETGETKELSGSWNINKYSGKDHFFVTKSISETDLSNRELQTEINRRLSIKGGDREKIQRQVMLEHYRINNLPEEYQKKLFTADPDDHGSSILGAQHYERLYSIITELDKMEPNERSRILKNDRISNLSHIERSFALNHQYDESSQKIGSKSIDLVHKRFQYRTALAGRRGMSDRLNEDYTESQKEDLKRQIAALDLTINNYEALVVENGYENVGAFDNEVNQFKRNFAIQAKNLTVFMLDQTKTELAKIRAKYSSSSDPDTQKLFNDLSTYRSDWASTYESDEGRNSTRLDRTTMRAQAQDYTAGFHRNQLQPAHPLIINSRAFSNEDLAAPTAEALQVRINTSINDYIDKINEASETIQSNPELIYKMDGYKDFLFDELNVEEGSTQHAILEKAFKESGQKTGSEIFLMVLGISLGILTFGPGAVGTFALFASFGLDSYSLYKELKKYHQEDALYDIGFMTQDPSLFGIVTSALSLGWDSVDIFKLLKSIAKPAKKLKQGLDAGVDPEKAVEDFSIKVDEIVTDEEAAEAIKYAARMQMLESVNKFKYRTDAMDYYMHKFPQLSENHLKAMRKYLQDNPTSIYLKKDRRDELAEAFLSGTTTNPGLKSYLKLSRGSNKKFVANTNKRMKDELGISIAESDTRFFEYHHMIQDHLFDIPKKSRKIQDVRTQIHRKELRIAEEKLKKGDATNETMRQQIQEKIDKMNRELSRLQTKLTQHERDRLMISLLKKLGIDQTDGRIGVPLMNENFLEFVDKTTKTLKLPERFKHWQNAPIHIGSHPDYYNSAVAAFFEIHVLSPLKITSLDDITKLTGARLIEAREHVNQFLVELRKQFLDGSIDQLNKNSVQSAIDQYFKDK